MVGHALGLGDRHAENILLDVTNGECVHVDFDCLFDKGLTLARPEICPFRLTPNIVDAMGITGYEGVFRRVCEVALRVLREQREMLVSVLQVGSSVVVCRACRSPLALQRALCCICVHI